MTKEQQEQFDAIIYDKNARVNFIDKTFVTPSSLPYLEKSVYSFILNKLFPKPPSDELKFGIAAHKCIIEGAKAFSDAYIIVPESISKLSKNSNDYKNKLKEFNTNLNGREIITLENKNKIIEIQSAFYSSEFYDEIFDENNQEFLAEEMIEFEYNSVKCRGRLDIATKKDEFWTVFDLKTTQDTLDLDSIHKSINNFKYYRQMEMYKMAIQSRYHQVPDAKLIFLGKEFPYLPVCVDNLGNRYYETARMDIFFLTERWREFIENKDYVTIADKYQSRVNFDAPLWLKSVGVY